MTEKATSYKPEGPDELSEINLFIRTPEGFDAHVKLAGPYNGGTARKLGELSKALADAGFVASSRNGSANHSNSSADGPACPEHGAAKVGPSKFGGGVYCKARNDDGSWCQWRSKEPTPLQARAVAS